MPRTWANLLSETLFTKQNKVVLESTRQNVSALNQKGALHSTAHSPIWNGIKFRKVINEFQDQLTQDGTKTNKFIRWVTFICE